MTPDRAEEFRAEIEKRLHLCAADKAYAMDIAVQVYAESVAAMQAAHAEALAEHHRPKNWPDCTNCVEEARALGREMQAVYAAEAEIATLKAAHEARVTELLTANGAEVERLLDEVGALTAELAGDDPTCMQAEHGGHPTCPHMEEEREELQAENERLKAELAGDSLRRMLAAKIVRRVGEGIDIDELLAANKEYEAENERLKGERDKAVARMEDAEAERSQGRNDRMRADNYLRERDEFHGELNLCSERLVLADNLAGLVRDASQRSDRDAAWPELHRLAYAYLASREGAGEREPAGKCVALVTPLTPGIGQPRGRACGKPLPCPDHPPAPLGDGRKPWCSCTLQGRALRSVAIECQLTREEHGYRSSPAQPSEDPGQVAADARQITISEALRVALKGLDYYFENFEKDGEFDAGTSWQEMVRETIKDCRSIVYSRLADMPGGPIPTPPPEPTQVLAEALQSIADWRLPSPNYEASYGSNGARNYMRQLAATALAAFDREAAEPGRQA